MIGLLMRSVGSIIASLVVAMAFIIAIEGVSAVLHPFPAGVDTSDIEVCRAHVAKYPQWILALGVVGWGVTTFVSVWVATRLGVGRHPAHGLAIGLLLILAAAFNIYMLPYPIWFDILNFLVLPLGVVAGIRIARASQAPLRSTDAESDTSPDHESA